MGNTQGTHITGNGHQELQFLLFHKLATDPAASHEAQFYYNTIDKTVRIYDTAIVDSTWNYLPKIERAFTNPQLLIGDGFFIKPIVAPVSTSFVLVDENSTPSFVDIDSMFTDNILNYDSALRTYRPYTARKLSDPGYAYMYTGTEMPNYNNRINIDGNLWARSIISQKDGTGITYAKIDFDGSLTLADANNTFLLSTNSSQTQIYAQKAGVKTPLYLGQYPLLTDEGLIIDPANQLFDVNMTTIKLSKGVASKYYGTDANKNLVPMPDPLTSDPYWKRVGTILSPLTANNTLYVITTSGTAIAGESTSVYGVYGKSSTSSGIYGTSNSGYAFDGSVTSGIGMRLSLNPISTNTSIPILSLIRTTSNTATSGIGSYIEFINENTAGAGTFSGRFVNKLTDVTHTAEISSFEWWLCNAGTLAKKMELSGDGTLSVIYATTNHAIIGTTTSGYGVYGRSTSSVGVFGKSTSNTGIWGESTSGNGVYGTSSSAYGVQGYSDTGIGGVFSVAPTSTNTVVGALKVARDSSVGAANGIGVSIDCYVRTVDSAVQMASQIATKWTNATYATRTSAFEWWLHSSGTFANKLLLTGNGSLSTLRAQYHYHSQTIGVDTAGDWRTFGNGTAFYTEYCTVGAATLGGGTWVVKQTIAI